MDVRGLTKKFLGIGLLCLPLTMTTTLTGCLTEDDDDDTTTTPPAGDSLDLDMGTFGAQSNPTEGSFIELDAWEVLTTGGVSSGNAAEIDLIFAYSTSQNAASIYSPKAAADGISGSAGFDFVKNELGNSAATTEIRSINKATYDGLDTKAELDAAWAAAASTATTTRLALAEDAAFIAKSGKGLLVAVLVTDLTASATGSADVEAKAKW